MMENTFGNKEGWIERSIYILMVFTLANVIGEVIVVEFTGLQQFIYILLMVVILQLLFYNPFLFYFLGATGAIMTFIYARIWQADFLDKLKRLFFFIENIVNHITKEVPIHPENAGFLWVFLAIFISLYTLVILLKIKKTSLLLPLYAGSFLYYWYIYIDRAYPMMALFFLLYFILLAQDQYHRVKKNWQMERTKVLDERIYPSWIKTSILYSFTIIVLATILPKPQGSIPWQWLDEKVVTYFPLVTELRGEEVVRGFLEMQPQSKPLGGPLTLGDEVVLEVKAPYPLYLRGEVRTYYGENQWRTEDFQWKEIQNNIKRMEEIEESQLITLEITPRSNALKLLFHPYRLVEINRKGFTRMMMDPNEQVRLEFPIHRGETYRIKAFVPRKNQESAIMEKNLDQKESYLQVPPNLSKRTIDLVEKIVEKATTPYERALAVEEYLRKNYAYSLGVSPIPQGEEFIDYFLFKEKAGYCTYFATTMAIMLRTQGIPTRYVEGYRMPGEREKGIYYIRERDAHAWVEAWIDPYGWISFEPTPAFLNVSPWEGSNLGENIENPYSLEEEEELLRLWARQEGLGERVDMDDIFMKTDQGMGLPDEFKSNGGGLISFTHIKKGLALLLLLLLMGGVPLRVAYVYIRRIRYFQYIQWNREGPAISYLYKNSLHILEMLGYPMEKGETPYEYAQRMIASLYGRAEEFKQLTEAYVLSKYGGFTVEDEEKGRFLAYYLYMEKKVRYHLGIWKYLYLKYIRGSLLNTYGK